MRCGGRLGGFSCALSTPQYSLKDSRTLNCDWHIHVAPVSNMLKGKKSFEILLSRRRFFGICRHTQTLLQKRNFVDFFGALFYTLFFFIFLLILLFERNELTIRYRQHDGTHFGSLFGFPAQYTTDFFIKSHLATVLFNAPPGSSFRFLWENITITWRMFHFQKQTRQLLKTPCRNSLAVAPLRQKKFDSQCLTNPGAKSVDGQFTTFYKHKDGTEELFSSEDAGTIFFMTDRNRGGRGFVIEYKLGKSIIMLLEFSLFLRQSFDYIPALLGVFNRIIQNPDYPNEYNNSLSCSSSVMLESSRPILAKFLIMDIEENGRVFISFTIDSNITRKGFALQLMEQIHDCSSDQLILTEDDSPKWSNPDREEFFLLSEALAKGFIAYLETSCGDRVVIPKSGNRVITSLNYSEPCPSRTTCEWTVVAPQRKT
uniref:CUB domain-containing protein n=1 Tax=Onchocerca volvulus TaxID=6282 RepID=A0A8R1TMU4_ONCVO